MTLKPRTGLVWHQSEEKYWKQAGGGWERWEPEFLYSLSAVDPTLIRALDLRSGQRVLDAACGLGEPTLAIASLVRPRGTIIGIDLSPSMLATARRRARARRARNVRFQVRDLNRLRWRGPAFDRVASRYGIMFVTDVDSALRGLLEVLRPGGRAAFAVWGDPARNSFFRVRQAAAAPFVEERSGNLEEAPGPMRFSRPGSLSAAMRRVGFRGLREEEVDVAMVNRNPESSAQLVVDTSMNELWQQLGRKDRVRLWNRLIRGIRPYWDGRTVRFPGLARVVSGHKPRKTKRAPR